MNKFPGSIEISTDAVRELATECWRLGSLAKRSALLGDDQLALERSARRLGETLSAEGIRISDLAGEAYDAGMIPEVLEVQIDSLLAEGDSVIDETVLPTVSWNGNILQIGQIVVKQGHARRDL